MKILKAADHRRMPWKNGGGETVEIAIFPEGAGLDDFDWRISMARVDGDGPFSSFAGIDRTLAILEGEGIVLDIEGQPPRRLVQASEPHSFPADRPTTARLIRGPILDLNVMSRRGRISHEVIGSTDVGRVMADALHVIVCASGSLALERGGRVVTLAAQDAAVLDIGESAELVPAAGSKYYLARLTAA